MLRRLSVWLDSHRPLGQRHRAEAFAAAAAQACRCGIEADVLAAFDMVRETLLDLAERDRRREQNAALRGGAGKLRHGEEWLARQSPTPDRCCAPRPLARRNAPFPPRLLAMRSG